MKILLLGANGQVGFELLRALSPLGDVLPATRSGVLPGGKKCEPVDLGQTQALANALSRTAPDLIVNAAAYTAVDRAEDEPALAESINHHALQVIGQWAKENQSSVVHYSTDYVFDGAAACPYREDAAVAPLGVYGRSKLAGERALVESGCEHLILRTAWVYAARGHNFLRTMLRLGYERDQLKVVNDQYGAPTSSRLLAATTLALLVRKASLKSPQRRALDGVYHLTASGMCSWFDFSSAIIGRAVAAGFLKCAPEMIAIATKDFPTKARRPAYSVLDTTKIRDNFGISLPAWESGLDDVIGELAEIRKVQMGTQSC